MKPGGLQLIVALGLFAAPFAAKAQPPIRIGASPSQTGAGAASGQNQLRGYQLCVQAPERHGRSAGAEARLVVYDDGSDLATAVRLYEKLIAQGKVDLVLGPNSAHPCRSAAPRSLAVRQRPSRLGRAS